MIILGISGGVRPGNQDGAAALVIGGRVIAALEEERVNRIKHAPGCLPIRAAEACLAQAGVSIRDVDELVFAGATYADIETRLRRFFESRCGHCPKIELVDHHLAHAASAYYASGFQAANILTADLSGDGISTTLCHAAGPEIDVWRRFAKPNSLGIFYSIITQWLGFARDNDEYKVMGLASYGEPSYDLRSLLAETEDGYCFNEGAIVPLRRDAPNPSKQEPLYHPDLGRHLPVPPRLPSEPIREEHKTLAASAQRRLEDVVHHLVRLMVNESGSRDLCLAGGVALNCSMNGTLLRASLVDRLFVPPGASDAGLALGAAWIRAVAHGCSDIEPMNDALLGPASDDAAIEQTLRQLGVGYKRVDDADGYTAREIAAGRIVGYFQGGSEFGPRALGGRSILADPRDPAMKDKINARIKFREEFRPFAPAVLAERAADYFDCDGPSPFMTVAVPAKKDRAAKIPAVVHVDGTSRIQTVDRAHQPRFHRLISAFEAVTGVPVVLNTSFNVAGQPIVCSPREAVSTLFGCGMDVLAIGPFIVDKNGRS